MRFVADKGSVIFYWEGSLWKFFKFWKFLVIPYCMSKIFLIPPEVLQNSSDPPPLHLIIKAAELVSAFEAEIDHPLGLLKVKAGNLRGILIAVRVKLQNWHHINILYTTDKKFRKTTSLHTFIFHLLWETCYHGKREIFLHLSCLKVQKAQIWHRGNS